MRLTCPDCGRPARPTTPEPRTVHIGQTPRAFAHPDGSPLCVTPADGPSWPDDADTWLTDTPIPADAIALPRRHPCRLTGGAVTAAAHRATVVDGKGGIDCPATVAAGRCPVANAGLPAGGLAAGGGCWLRAHLPHQVIAAAYRRGVALPHQVPGFAHQRLDATRTRALAHWLRRHRDTAEQLLNTAPAAVVGAALAYTAAWLDLAATTGGVRTARLALLHPPTPPRRHHPAPTRRNPTGPPAAGAAHTATAVATADPTPRKDMR